MIILETKKEKMSQNVSWKQEMGKLLLAENAICRDIALFNYTCNCKKYNMQLYFFFDIKGQILYTIFG